MERAKLGEILYRRGLITEAQLAHALHVQRKTGSRLGDILIGDGMIDYWTLYHAVAEHYTLPFIDLLKEPPDPRLLKESDTGSYLWLNAIPWRRHENKIWVAVCDPSEEILAWIRQKYGPDSRIVITSPIDIRRTVTKRFGKIMENASRMSLWRTLPDASARVTANSKQLKLMYGMLCLCTVLSILLPIHTALALIILCHIAYAITMLFKWWIFAWGTTPPPQQHWKETLAALPERDLPVYTILVPMYREAESLPGLMESIKRLDYPACKLDIKLVLEADDKTTLAAARTLRPHYHFDIIRVPPAVPRTKPKACNYALRFARGEFVTVYDADDRPERLQLKKAVHAFRTLPPDVVCLQARLNYYNANDNLLTRFFSLEYTILFHFMLYGLQRLGLPIPLGGTSNHMALTRLKALGEWDPYNVTEDADLGVRLAIRGFRTAMLDSWTMEEAPNALRPWICQRSRWIKGYMQTWLVHMRAPSVLRRRLGWKNFLGFQFFIGFPSFAFLSAPLVWVLSLLWVGKLAQWHPIPFPDWLGLLTLANLALNLITHWYLSFYCATLYQKHRPAIIAAALLYPLYLLLHSIASYKALWQLIVKPHYWEKTTHGLARRTDLASLEGQLLRKQRGGVASPPAVTILR